MDLLPKLALAVLASLVLTRLLMPAARKLGEAWGLVDHPSWRRRQKAAVPCSGGLAIYLVGVVAAVVLWVSVGPAFDSRALVALGVSGLGTIILGVVDDRFGLHAEKKLLGQALIVSLPMAAGLTLDSFTLPYFGAVELGVFAGPLTLLWYLGFINSVNLIDGLDGLAAGIAAIVLSTIMLTVVGADPVGALWVGVLLGSVLGFLRDNLSGQRIFLGDAGSMLLGLWLGGLTLGLASQTPSVGWVALFAMAVPVLDTMTTISRRWRRGISLFRPDAEHLHHRLLRLGTTPFRATLTLWFVTLASSSLGALLIGREQAAVFAVFFAAAAVVELAYVLERDQHPGLGSVLAYIFGIRTQLQETGAVAELAEVIEMEVYRAMMDSPLPESNEPTAAPTPLAARAEAAGASNISTAAPGEALTPGAEDVVLAVPKDTL